MTADEHPDYEAMDRAIASFPTGHPHEDCRRLLKEACAAGGTEITVSTMGPIFANPYSTPAACPHGTTFWIEPTAEQLMDWRRRGVG